MNNCYFSGGNCINLERYVEIEGLVFVKKRRLGMVCPLASLLYIVGFIHRKDIYSGLFKESCFPSVFGAAQGFLHGVCDLSQEFFTIFTSCEKRLCESFYLLFFRYYRGFHIFTGSYSLVFIHKVFHSLCITYPGEFLRFFLSCCQSGSSEVFAALVFSLVSSV